MNERRRYSELSIQEIDALQQALFDEGYLEQCAGEIVVTALGERFIEAIRIEREDQNDPTPSL